MITIFEVMEELKTIDEITLLERLEISSEDLVERFFDRIEDLYEELAEEFKPESTYQDEE